MKTGNVDKCDFTPVVNDGRIGFYNNAGGNYEYLSSNENAQYIDAGDYQPSNLFQKVNNIWEIIL